MAYYNSGWHFEPPKPKATVKRVEMAKKDDLDALEVKVNKLAQFIKDNRHYSEAVLERLQEVEGMLGIGSYDRNLARIDWIESRIEELRNEIARMRGNMKARTGSKKRAKVTICAGKDKVIVRV